MIRGQCMQVLLNKMKYDNDWTIVSELYDPLQLIILLKKQFFPKLKTNTHMQQYMNKKEDCMVLHKTACPTTSGMKSSIPEWQ